jgi:hypothetical protein
MLYSDVEKRVFIVGCPRSGTTLLQSLLAANSQVYSFPESQFFPFLFKNDQASRFLNSSFEPNWLKVGLKLAARKLVFGTARSQLHDRIQDFLCDISQHQYYTTFPQSAIALKTQYTRAFWHTLDQVTTAQQKTVWLEKSPQHLYYLDYIAQHIPQVIFIHILRSGVDVIASLYDVRQRHPNHWGQVSATPKNCTNEWLRAIKISRRYRDCPNHLIISYEQLVTQPEAVIRQLCRAISVEFESDMLTNYAQIAQEVSLSSEPWKQKVQQPIQNQNSMKFVKMFSPDEQSQIHNSIAGIDLEEIVNLTVSSRGV